MHLLLFHRIIFFLPNTAVSLRKKLQALESQASKRSKAKATQVCAQKFTGSCGTKKRTNSKLESQFCRCVSPKHGSPRGKEHQRPKQVKARLDSSKLAVCLCRQYSLKKHHLLSKLKVQGKTRKISSSAFAL